METAPQLTLEYQPPGNKPRVGALAWCLLSLVGLAVTGWGLWGAAMVLYWQMWRDYGAGLAMATWKTDFAMWMRAISGWLVFPSMFAAFLLLLAWLAHSCKRVVRAGVGGFRYSPLGVVAAWFMPQSFLIGPYEVMKALYALARGKARPAATPLVGTWWACWLLSEATSLLAIVASGKRESGETDAEFAAGRAIWALLPAPWFVISGVLLMVLVWRVAIGIRSLELQRSGQTP